MNPERKAKVQQLATRLKAMTEDQKITFVANNTITNVDGHTLSLNNAVLLFLQLYEQSQEPVIPTVVGGYRQWQRVGRQVQKGEHGSIIWFPRIVGQNEDDPGELQGFMLATVFDISQTKELGASED